MKSGLIIAFILLFYANISFAQDVNTADTLDFKPENTQIKLVTPYDYLDRGLELFFDNRLDSSEIYLKRALEPSPELGGPWGDSIRRLGYGHLMHIAMERGEHAIAVEYGLKGIEINRRMGDTLFLASAHFFTGKSYAYMSKLEPAIEHYTQAFRLAEKIRDHHLAFTASLALTGVYSGRESYPEAMYYLQRSTDHLEGRRGDSAILMNAFGRLLIDFGKYEQAIEAFERSKQISKEFGNRQVYDASDYMLTLLMEKTGRHEEVLAKIIVPDPVADSFPQEEPYDRPGSYIDMEARMRKASDEASDRQTKFDILHREYLERQARNLRNRIWMISALAVLIIISLLLLYNRQRQKAKAEAAARYAQEKENEYIVLQQESELRMIRRYIDGLESERGRISKELHDGICNDLLAVEMGLRNGGKDISGQTELLKKAREDIRNVSHELMPPVFQYASIDEILADYTDNLPVPEGMAIRYAQKGGNDWNDIPRNTALEVYRVAQEALSNSIKHSGASEIEVTLTTEADAPMLCIHDNGTGFDKVGRNNGAGLRIIRERVESTGGSLEIKTDESGTVIVARFGLKQ